MMPVEGFKGLRRRAVLVAALLGGTGLLSACSTGADTPEEAVAAFTDALRRCDVAAITRVLDADRRPDDEAISRFVAQYGAERLTLTSVEIQETVSSAWRRFTLAGTCDAAPVRLDGNVIHRKNLKWDTDEGWLVSLDDLRAP